MSKENKPYKPSLIRAAKICAIFTMSVGAVATGVTTLCQTFDRVAERKARIRARQRRNQTKKTK